MHTHSICRTRVPYVFVIFFIFLLSGCSTTPRFTALNPEQAIASGRGAIDSIDGVTVSARFGAWEGKPRELDEVLIPLLVRVKNSGTQPVKLNYKGITLSSLDEKMTALSPFEITGSVNAFVPGPRGGFRQSFLFGSYYRPFGWRGRYGFMYDPFFYDPFYDDFSYTVNVPLPTWEMMQRAVPEKVLNPGEEAIGFLYFQRFKKRPRSVEVNCTLYKERSGKPLAPIVLSFMVQ